MLSNLQSTVTNRFMVGLKSFYIITQEKNNFYFLFTKYVSLVKTKIPTKEI